MNRRSFLAPVIAAAIVVPAMMISAPAMAARGVSPATNPAVTGATPFPDSVSLPTNFAPEGIASGAGSTFYSASLATGDIYEGDQIRRAHV